MPFLPCKFAGERLQREACAVQRGDHDHPSPLHCRRYRRPPGGTHHRHLRRVLPGASALQRVEGSEFAAAPGAVFTLDGVRSNERYVERAERTQLVAVQEDLGRLASRCAVLIPIRKSAAWWALPQDERRAIFEARSHHTEVGLRYLPAIARRLYHSRDLGGPFDFLTFFEFGEADTSAFDDLLGKLRETEEWSYVDREVEIRLRRAGV
ncbi:MAG: chlorite dismutase family protein [Sandaracinaceae bacterium]|nr:chlorite dismutase family protein [Sandaracinaceae bacterium]